MSDIKTMNLTSLVSKKTRRAKARLMQNFGKADKTTDELFEVYQQNFNRQQSTAINLQKHVKHYLHCLKELHESSKVLSHCLLDMHENDWPKHDVFENNAYEIDHLNEDLEEKLKESVLAPLEQYLCQFSEIREKIAKRGRKLVDYDSQRHTYDVLQQSHQANNNKQSDDSKLSKARDQLGEAKRVYESLNNELHEELPALYDNRLPFTITVFQQLFTSEISYHSDKAAVYKSYMETVEQLAKATEKGILGTSASLATVYTQAQNKPALPKPNINTNIRPTNNETTQPNGATTDPRGSGGHQAGVATSASSITGHQQSEEQRAMMPPVSQKAPVYLHKVRATYKYMAEDEDELSFEAGEIIQVIEYEDPSEQEEGWLMGIKESTGQKGLFPANFTKEI